MTGVAEVDEPLAVEAAGHVLQDRDALAVVLDQVVVGGKDRSDASLDGEGWNGIVGLPKQGMMALVISQNDSVLYGVIEVSACEETTG